MALLTDVGKTEEEQLGGKRYRNQEFHCGPVKFEISGKYLLWVDLCFPPKIYRNPNPQYP